MSGMMDLIRYDVSEQAIAEMKERFAGVSFNSPEAYEEGRKAIGTCRGLRTAVEKRRVELKASSLEFGRRVDAAAKELTAAIEAIESPMRDAKKAIDDEEARKKYEAENAERLAKEAAEREAAEAAAAMLKAQRDAEAKRLADEKLANEREADRLREEEAKLGRERRANEKRQREEAERLEKQRRELDERQAAIEKAERDRALAAQRESDEKARGEREAKEAAARVERERVATEGAAAKKAADEAAAKARAEALKPDKEKLMDLAGKLRSLTGTWESVAMKTTDGRDVLIDALERLAGVGHDLEAFGS